MNISNTSDSFKLKDNPCNDVIFSPSIYFVFRLEVTTEFREQVDLNEFAISFDVLVLMFLF